MDLDFSDLSQMLVGSTGIHNSRHKINAQYIYTYVNWLNNWEHFLKCLWGTGKLHVMLPSNHITVNINRVSSSGKNQKKPLSFFHQNYYALKHSSNKICQGFIIFFRIIKTLLFLEVVNLFEYKKAKPRVYLPSHKHLNKTDPTVINLRVTSGSLTLA